MNIPTNTLAAGLASVSASAISTASASVVSQSVASAVSAPSPLDAAPGETDAFAGPTEIHADDAAGTVIAEDGFERHTDVAAEAPTGPIKMYSSHPVMRFAIGNFQFENGRLDLFSQEQVDAFEAELAWLAKNQPTIRANIKTIDLDAAAAFASKFNPTAARGGTDTSMMRAGIAVQAAMKNSGEVA